MRPACLGREKNTSLVGRQLGRYRVTAALREGAMGAVYLAEDRSLERFVALKTLKRQLADDRRLVERLRTEARTMATIEHRNVAQVYDFVETPEHVYLVLEYLDGDSVKDHLERRGRLPEKEAWIVAKGCAQGLAAAHAQGILHRDIKPSNIMITREGVVKVTDFGIADVISGDPDHRPVSKSPARHVEGTPHYMSPEQCRGAALDARSDIYSLGVMLFQLISGRLPYEGSSIQEILLKHVREPIPDLRESVELLPATAALVRRMMAKDPAHRPQSAAEVIDAISPNTRAGPAAGEGRPRRRWMARAGWVFSAIAGVGALTIGGSVGWKSTRRSAAVDAAWKRVEAVQDPEARHAALVRFLAKHFDSERADFGRRELARVREQLDARADASEPPSRTPNRARVGEAEVAHARDVFFDAYRRAQRQHAAKIAPEEVARALRLVEEGEDFEADEEWALARDRYREAQAVLAEVDQELAKAEEEREEVRAVVREYETLRAEAIRLSIATLAPLAWMKAEQNFQRGRALLEGYEAFRAKRAVEFAIRDLRSAVKEHRAAGRRRSAERSRLAEPPEPVVSSPPPLTPATIVPPHASLFSVTPTTEDGRLVLRYRSGQAFRDDVSILRGQDNVNFARSPVGDGSDPVTFGGSDHGFLLLDAVFNDEVEVELDVRFMYVVHEERAPFFRIVLMAEDGVNFYASDFGTNVAIYKNGRRTSQTLCRHRPYRKSPARWVPKERDLRIKVSYRGAEDGRGRLAASYRFSEGATRRTDAFRRGKVGFWWENVVFDVRDLEVRGRLDEEWSARALESERRGDGSRNGEGH